MSIFKTGVYCLSLLSLSAATANTKAVANRPQKQEMVPSKPCLKYPGDCPAFMVGGDTALAWDYFRSLPDGSFAGNSGALASLNLVMSLKREFGAQLGGSYGLYDWDARGSTTTEHSKALQQ